MNLFVLSCQKKRVSAIEKLANDSHVHWAYLMLGSIFLIFRQFHKQCEKNGIFQCQIKMSER